MAQSPRYAVPFRRRREGKTDYKLRKALIRSGKPRAVVRLSNKYVYVQITDAQAAGDIIRAAASSKELVKLGWRAGTANLPSAYLTGALAGRRALAKGVKEAVLDIGLKSVTRGSRVFAALKGLADSGLMIPHSAEIVPPMERIGGSHIAAYAKALSTTAAEAYKNRFSAYLVRGLKPEELSSHFERVRSQIQSVASEGVA